MLFKYIHISLQTCIEVLEFLMSVFIKTKNLGVFLLVALCLYYAKCQANTDLFSLSLKKYFPFNYLQSLDNKLAFADVSADGLVFSDDFNSRHLKKEWSDVWMREKGSVSLNASDGFLSVDSKSEKDWSLSHRQLVAVSAGDCFLMKSRITVQGSDNLCHLNVILYDADKKVIRWTFAKAEVKGESDWQTVSKKFLVPDGVAFLRFRLVGAGKGTCSFDDILFSKVDEGLAPESVFSGEAVLENDFLKYSFFASEKNISVEDKRTGEIWQFPFLQSYCLINDFKQTDNELAFSFVNAADMSSFLVRVSLLNDSVKYAIEAEADVQFDSFAFPPFIQFDDNDKCAVPLQSGLLLEPQSLPSSLRHGGGLPLACLGVLRNQSSFLQIINSPYDFRMRFNKGKNVLRNAWVSEKGVFGYPREITHCFIPEKSYVLMAKKYREYAVGQGLIKSLKKKASSRKIDALVGAVNVWYFGTKTGLFAGELKNAGMEKVLYSNVRDSLEVDEVNHCGYLSSVYDIYQDVWPPAYHYVTKLTEGWPDDLVLDKSGDWVRWWTIKRKGKEYPGGLICSKCGLERAKKEIPRDLEEKKYSARFIDTTTASPWRECYNPQHPITRLEDVKYKMALLSFVSDDMGLVTGSENGADCAVPFCDYFEGMMSIGRGRLPGSGRGVAKVPYMSPTDNFKEYQVGVEKRIPFWDLVFHDCVVSTWYWGDASNRIPEYWHRKDLFNILYGNMPLFAIRDWNHWKEYEDRFVESYKNVCTVFEKVGYKEMLSHRFVTEDKKVQETVFSENIRVVVNFSDEEYRLVDEDYMLPGNGFVVFDNKSVWFSGICSKMPAPRD